MAAPNRCRTSVQDSVNNGIPVIEYQYFAPVYPSPPATFATVVRDLKITFSKPYRFFFLASLWTAAGSAFFSLHEKPLGYPQFVPGGIGGAAETGSETTIFLHNEAVDTNDPIEARQITFDKYVQTLYCDVGPEVATGVIKFTVGASNDIEDFLGERT